MDDPGDSTVSLPAADESPAESEPPERLDVAIVEEAGDWSGFAAPAEAIVAAAEALAHHPRCSRARGATASVVLGDDALLRSLNRTYRGKDASTNVLSFPFQPPPGPEQGRYLGDVVLAAETVAREAGEQATLPVHHLQHLVVHGLLHLLGFDHEDDDQAETMERLEAQILATLGIADPYAPAGQVKVP
jgi:probable rRNA maturation factor